MKIDRIELRQIFLPYLAPFSTSGWTEEGNHAIIVRIDAEGITAWGESPVGANPFYNEENQKTAWVIMQDYLVPMLTQATISSPWDVTPAFARVRGNRMAQSGLEFTVWDWFAKKQGVSLAKLLGGTRDRVAVGVSVGIQKDIPTLLKVVGGYLDQGYKRIKLKIKPGWDIEPTRAVREAWPDLLLQVDANSIYHLSDAEHLAQLDQFNLLLVEQPLEHDDIFDHAKLQKLVNAPICLDESIVSPAHARWAIEMNACKVINIKPSRIGGFGDAIKIHDMTSAAGIPVWHGGMLETGIGRTGNVALASLPNFTLPGDISANDRYFKRDIVKNPFTINPDSTLTVPTVAGNGAIVDEDFLDDVTLATWEWKA